MIILKRFFESLNSTGKQLEDSDLVRNFILMRQDARTQEYYYNTYWHKIEQNTNPEMNDYIRNYLTYKLNNVPNQNLVYKTFKDFVYEKYDINSMESLLSELLEFSQYFNKIRTATTDSEEANTTLKYI